MTTSPSEFRQQVERIRKLVFPAWDRQRQWRIVQTVDLNGALGRCESSKKRIRVLFNFNGDELDLVLVHEIVHAIASGGHGERWYRRMEKAAVDAEQGGLCKLSQLIREEIVGYKQSPRITAGDVYDEIRRAVTEASNASFLNIVDWVARGMGCSRKELLLISPKARRIYDQATKEVAKAKIAQKLAHCQNQC